MAFYLVSAVLEPDLSKELEQLLRENAFVELQPFGKVLSHSLRNARIRVDGFAVWEEEDYCTPPLAQERAAVLDRFFERLSVRPSRWEKAGAESGIYPGFSLISRVERIELRLG